MASRKLTEIRVDCSMLAWVRRACGSDQQCIDELCRLNEENERLSHVAGKTVIASDTRGDRPPPGPVGRPALLSRDSGTPKGRT
jgi:hypothetical protein